MERKTLLRRAALVWGALVVAAQLWAALVFVRWFLQTWKDTRPYLVSFAESANRFSQLKTPAFKYPWSGIYFLLGVVGVVGVLGWIWAEAVRDLIASAPNTDESR
jgi:hypothetical protein